MSDPKQMTLAELRAEIERLDAAASKGPWRSKLNHAPYKIVEIDRKEWYTTLELLPQDADFIAFARTALPELLRRLLVAQEALESIAESGWGIKTNPTATNALAEIRGNAEAER